MSSTSSPALAAPARSELSSSPQIPITSDFQPKPVRRITKTHTSNGRPGTLQRIPSVQTRYMDMLLSQDTIPRLHNILASFLQWVLLAGYLVLPATFNSIRNSDEVQTSSEDGNIAAKTALAAVQNLPLLYVGAFCTGIGLLGKFLLFLRHAKNYVWLVNKIFMSVMLEVNSSCSRTLTQDSQAWSHELLCRCDIHGHQHLWKPQRREVCYCADHIVCDSRLDGDLPRSLHFVRSLGVTARAKSPR